MIINQAKDLNKDSANESLKTAKRKLKRLK